MKEPGAHIARDVSGVERAHGRVAAGIYGALRTWEVRPFHFPSHMPRNGGLGDWRFNPPKSIPRAVRCVFSFVYLIFGGLGDGLILKSILEIARDRKAIFKREKRSTPSPNPP